MSARRELIVVSNRGPVTFGRDADGNRVARRGGGGLVTALRSLVQHHDVTWIASAITDEDSAVAEEASGEALDETAADGSPYRLRLVAHDPHGVRPVLQRRLEPDAVVRPALPLGPPERAEHRPGAATRLDGRLRAP